MDQNNGTEAKISKEETRTLITITLGEIPLMRTRISLQDQILHMGTAFQLTEDHMTNAQLSHSVEAMGTDLEINFLTIGMQTFLVLHRLQGQTSYKQKNSYRQPRSYQPKNAAFRRSDTRPATGLTPYEQKFPQSKNPTSYNVVRFTTTDDTNNKISDFAR